MAFGKRRPALLATGLAALLSLSAACGTAGPGSASGASAWALTGPDEQLVTGSMQQWSENHPDASLKPQFYANDAYSRRSAPRSVQAERPP